ncbi:MAG: AMP-binding protein [Clostridia bacterium]|nr:AMP-binding protein [Clostridia bacterium]
MDTIIKRYLPRTEFESYEDFKENFTIEYPDDFIFAYDCVDEWARLEPEKPALVWTNDAGDIKRFTFSDIKRYSDKVANVFRSNGINKGDVVMLILKQRPEVWFSIVALEKLGAICIPASFQLTPKDVVYRANAANIKMIVCVDDQQVVEHVASSMSKCPTVEKLFALGDNIPEGFEDFGAAIEAASEDFERPSGDMALRTKENMLVYFSSGTTGMPKMVLHNHSLPLAHIVTARYWQCVQENKIHLTQTDSGWAKFAWGKIYGQWLCGATIGAYDTEKFTPIGMINAIERIKPTTFCAPATIYRFLMKEDLTKFDFSFIEHASIAGEPLNPEVFRKIDELTGLKLREGFGQTESSVLLANFPWIDVKPGSMGKPSPIYDIDLVDENGNSCEDGVVGSIVIKNTDKKRLTGLFMEYWKDAEVTEKCWKDGTYNTHDMAWRDSDGYYWFEGRNDDVIKCSGYRIGPFEVESALLEHPGVLECAVTAAADPIRGQVVKAFIVLARGYSPSDELTKELQNHVKKVTAPYKYPRIVEYLDELPKTTSGKIQRNVLRDRSK